jgi:hypothetical protein
MEQQFSQWVLDMRLPDESRYWSQYQFENRRHAHYAKMRDEMQEHMDSWTEEGWLLTNVTEQTLGYGAGSDGIDLTRFTFFWRRD